MRMGLLKSKFGPSPPGDHGRGADNPAPGGARVDRLRHRGVHPSAVQHWPSGLV